MCKMFERGDIVEVKDEALAFDPSSCSNLSMEQKRKLVYEMSKWPDSATEILQSWSRQEILQILCAELGKERKYTGLTKSKMIEQLLKIVYEKESQELVESANISENGERNPKRQRKSDNPNRQLVATNGAATIDLDVESGYTVYCKNSACKAKMNSEHVFCKRCSCCICRKYDDNKDPSLWLICNSDPPFHGVSCGMSCHLECALRHENSGISQDRQDKGLDGSFCCVACGKVNDLLSSWRKQLVVARDTRRVDILCYRLSLGQKILAGTKHYQNLYGIIDEAVKKLEEDVGPLTGLPVKKARGIVNRLSSGPEIQRLCAFAVESLDLMLSNRVSDIMPSGCNTLASKLVRFEDIRASSLTVNLSSDDSNMENVVGYSLWHRKANDIDYPTEPTCRLFKPNTKFLLSGLSPSTQYFLKVVILDTDREMGFYEFQFQTGSSQDEARNINPKSLEVERSQSPTTNCSSLSNPSSEEDETNNIIPCNEDENREDNYIPFNGNADKTDKSQKETNPNGDALLIASNKESSNDRMVEETSTDNGSDRPLHTGLECVPYVDSSEANLPITPCKFENLKDDIGRSNRPKSSGKEIGSERDEEPQAGSSSKKMCNSIGDKDFEYYVKVVRWLECDGHIETTFRQKFLTWYSLRATSQELRIVKVFIDTFIDDPVSLAGQLVDTFSDVVSHKRCSRVPAGFCTKLWH
ncbi:hypothetical protein DH2020_014078 [Rehmannia glutinosa]|uniref:VIN3-like protein n=1 Tax=Rehmannia glutinosa TaxID=99300 RepID=A0ABR0WWW5_REHGL